MIKLTPDRDLDVIKVRAGRVPMLIIRQRAAAVSSTGRTEADGSIAAPEGNGGAPGILWIHGGGYITGMKEMIYMSRAIGLIRKYGAVVVSPGYTLSWKKPYPAAVNDCYEALKYLWDHADELGVDRSKIIVGGESAGGGLAAAVCMMARDRGEIKVAFQLPLYPMLSNIDTISSMNNHGKVWNTRRNHLGWRLYLRKDAKKMVSPYASPSWQRDFRGLPPAYTFVGDGEPFYKETLDYVDCLRSAGVEAEADVYHTNMHAFDMLWSSHPTSRRAIEKFEAKVGELLGKL